MSLAVARPPTSAASRCSPARSVISSTAAGNSSRSSSVATPDTTASSDGYAGTPVAGSSARTPLSTWCGAGRLYWNL